MLDLRCSDAVDLFALWASVGSEDLARDDVPLLVVRGDTSEWSTFAAEPIAEMWVGLRGVLVAVVEGESPQEHHPASAFDVVLSTLGREGHCGVAVADVDAEIAGLATSTAGSPQASVALAQLLRLELFGDVASGLVAESLTYSMLQSGPEFTRWVDDRTSAAPPADDPEPPVLVDRDSGRHVITLNRTHRANAVSASLRDHLVEALRAASEPPTSADDGSRIELRGAGANFCSGGDLAEFATFPDPGTAHHIRTARSPAQWIHRLSPRIVAHVHGVCAGAGIELPAFASRVVAAPDADIWLPELSLGLIPGAGGTVSLPRRIGRHRTAWLGLSGNHLDATTAQRWGLVDDIVDDIVGGR